MFLLNIIHISNINLCLFDIILIDTLLLINSLRYSLHYRKKFENRDFLNKYLIKLNMDCYIIIINQQYIILLWIIYECTECELINLSNCYVLQCFVEIQGKHEFKLKV